MITQCPKTGRTCEVTGCDGCWKAEHEIIPSWEEYCECEGIPCEPVKPVDLTDDEIYEVLKRYTKTERYKDDFGSYRAVIAADREKNK